MISLQMPVYHPTLDKWTNQVTGGHLYSQEKI